MKQSLLKRRRLEIRICDGASGQGSWERTAARARAMEKTIELKIRISNGVARTARCSGSALKGLAPWVEHRFE
jgi:hypothetical protein